MGAISLYQENNSATSHCRRRALPLHDNKYKIFIGGKQYEPKTRNYYFIT
ncbi:hypothetical protein C8R11_1165 [Nitrosomonas aestuarii]|nr:hypothetical protein C8R11_1165 [Nitrosomonas aestuarii]